MPEFRFRLQTILDRAIDKQKDAGEALAERKKELVVEQLTLEDLRAEAARIAALYARKRSGRLEDGAGGGNRISKQTDYLLALKMDLQGAQSSVLSQELFVDQAREAVSEAQQTLLLCKQKVESLTKYRDKMEARFLQDAAYKEELEQDEIGNVMYLGRRNK